MENIPLFDHDPTEPRNPLSRPLLRRNGNPIPHRCLLSFMNDVLQDYVEAAGCPQADLIHSETCDYPLYISEDACGPFALIHVPVGGAAAAIVADLLIASGADTLVACGGCGVLAPIAQGRLIVATAALRDEGASYHYLAPTQEAATDPALTAIALETLAHLGVPHQAAKVWTSDGFFRETPSLIAARQAQGYDAVDMECASLAAVATCYGARFAEILYSGDSLEDCNAHNERDWLRDTSARLAAFRCALAVLEAAAL